MNNFILFLLFLWFNLKVLIFAIVPAKYRSKKDVSGEIVFITGGGGGFGRLFALKFAKLGCRIVVCDVDGKNNEETCRLVREAGGQATGYILDVSNRKEVYEIAERVKTEVGEVGILVNNAGIAIGHELLDETDEEVEKLMGVNLLAHFWTTKAFLPGMLKKNKGHLVYVASVAGIVGAPRMTSYASSKHGVMGFAESLQMELIEMGNEGVHVTVACPYFSMTGLFECSYDGLIPMPRPDKVVEDIVNGVLTNKDVVCTPKTMSSLWFFKPLTSRKSLLLMSKITVGQQLTDTIVVKKVGFKKD